MIERYSSTLILLGTVLVVLALWYLTYRVVRWDTSRRGIRPIVRKAWIIASIVLPIFGAALYLFMQVLKRYLTPLSDENDATSGNTDVFAPPASLQKMMEHISPEQKYRNKENLLGQSSVPEPAWGSTQPARANGKSHAYATPETIRAPYQALLVRYTLVAIEGPLKGQQFPIISLPLRIGRGEEAGIALDTDLNVSRKHAEIYEWNGRLRIRDLGSRHGVQVNDATSNDQALSPGDRIILGESVLILRELP